MWRLVSAIICRPEMLLLWETVGIKGMEMGGYELRVPNAVLYGMGCAKSVGEEARRLGGKKALVVTDPRLMDIGYPEEVKGYLEEAGLKVEIFAGVPTEPKMSYVEEGFKRYRETGCDILVGLGGGSCIDTAKGIAILATCGGSIRDYEGMNKVPKPTAPLIAMPTTAGTGSEVSKYAVITDVERTRKMLIGSPYILPDAAICDPAFTSVSYTHLTLPTTERV